VQSDNGGSSSEIPVWAIVVIVLAFLIILGLIAVIVYVVKRNSSRADMF